MKPVVSVAVLSALMMTSGCAGMFGGGDEASGPPAQRADIMAEQQVQAQREEVAPPEDVLSMPAPSAQPSGQTMASMQPRGQGAGPAVDSDLIRTVQSQLQQQGYQVGRIDGIYGPRTQQALRQYQQDQGFESSGRLNQQTVLALVGGGPQQAEMPQGQDQQGQGQGQGPQTGQDSLFERDQQGGGGMQDQQQNQQGQPQ